jgi:GT2 family glycosyltransferase
MKTTLPTICVAIPTYLREEVLVATIEQVLAQEPAPDEILVIDQTPKHDHETQDFLTSGARTGQFRWLKQFEPSLTKARNRALQEARSEVVLFVDDDVNLPPGFVEKHVRHYRSGVADATSGPISRRKVTNRPSGTQSPDIDPRVAALLGPKHPVSCLFGIPLLHGCNHSIRRSVALQSGGYDENFEASALFEETDFAFRAFAHGVRFVYDPDAWLDHLRVPYGGCRIPNNRMWLERQKTVSVWLFTLRHVVGGGLPLAVGALMARTLLRAGPLRRENVTRPWRQPCAWLALFAAFREAKRRCADGVRSPYSYSEETSPHCVEAN